MKAFPEDSCYPDRLDLTRIAKSYAPTVTDSQLTVLYQQFRLAFEWIGFVRHICWSDGKHAVQPISDLQKIAETFIGPLPVDAFLLAIREQGLKVSNGGVKFPSLGRLEDSRQRWNEYVESLS